MDEIKNLPHAYKPGNNPAGEKAYYYCHFCGLELHGEEVGFVGAGPRYANGEHPCCPACGRENSVDRDVVED